MGVGLKFSVFAIVLIAGLHHALPSNPKKLRIPPLTNFLLENDVCNIPNFDPWAFKEYYENKSYVPCIEDTPIVYFQKKDGKIYAILNETIKASYRNNSLDVECCVSDITRNQSSDFPDYSFSESICARFVEDSAEITNDVVRITCHKMQGDTNLSLYEDVHGIFVPQNLQNKDFPVNANGYSVLLIVIDSLSFGNFMRHLPKTYSFLTQNDYIHLKAYNQVGRNALPNMLPILTGYSHRLSRLKFGNPKKKFFDDYPFIWKDFENNEYITAFAADYSEKHAFNGNLMGFKKSPTTYYFRTYTLSSEKLHTTTLDKMPHCTGPSQAAERILNLALNFTQIHQDRNYFGLFWLNSFSRDDFNAPGRMDEKLEEFFKNLQRYQNNTITFILSDNGYYKDDVTRSIYGWVESRMPLGYVHLPPNFKLKHLNETTHLIINSRKLVSPYDIYATLQHILNKSKEIYTAKHPRSCRNCTSLFKEMPSARTCKEAGIGYYWCTCLNKKHIPYDFTNETSNYFVET